MRNQKSPQAKSAINPALEQLAKVRAKEEMILREAESAVKTIRDGLVEAVVVFVDMVDSTQYKVDHEATPEKWILRVKQFSEIIATYIESASGKVVKYIGDEVMGMFVGGAAINNALNFINRIAEIEASLLAITHEITRIKVVVDWGKVFLLEYDGHKEADPQGTPVDRCARIGKHAEKGTVLGSYEFVRHCEDRSKWTEIGSPISKGLGPTKIFQLGAKTINLTNKVLIDEEKIAAMDKKIIELTSENQRLLMDFDDAVRKNKKLEEQLEAEGAKAAPEDLVHDGKNEVEKAWEKFEKLVQYAAEMLNPLPNIVIEAFYHEYSGENFYPENDDYDAAAKAKQSGLLLQRGGSGWSTDDKSGKIRKAKQALDELSDFLRSPPADFYSEYEQAHDDERPEIDLRPFWNTHLGLRG